MSWEKKGTKQYNEKSKLVCWVKGNHTIVVSEHETAPNWYIYCVDDKLYNSSLVPRLTIQSDIDKLFDGILSSAPERAKNPFK